MPTTASLTGVSASSLDSGSVSRIQFFPAFWVILAGDQSYGDLAPEANRDASTPNLTSTPAARIWPFALTCAS